METHDLHIVQVEGISLVIHNKKIINPLSERFKKYVYRIASARADDILDRIGEHFQHHSRAHYLHKQFMGVENPEIPDVTLKNLNVCSVCFDYCAEKYINQHLKRAHNITKGYKQYTFRTTGHAIPTQKFSLSYLYKRPENTLAQDMMQLTNTAVTDNSCDQFLYYIDHTEYYGQGYPNYLATENVIENVGIRDAIQDYILKKRPYLQADSYIHSKMVQMGLLKSPFIEKTRIMYANLAARFFYTFSKFSENEVLQAAVYKPETEEVERAITEMVEKYVLVTEEKSGKFMKAVFISLMTKEDTFARSAKRAKVLDAINYLLKLAIADYMWAKQNTTEIFDRWEGTTYQAFEKNRLIHHRFNMTVPAFQTRVDEKDFSSITVGTVNFKILDLGKLVRCLVSDYKKKVVLILPCTILGVDELYKEFDKNAFDYIDNNSPGYSVFFGSPHIAAIASRSAWLFQRHMGDQWEDKEVMRRMYQLLCNLNLHLLVCILITCGSPYRITEVLTLTYANSAVMNRSMYYCNGAFELKIHYNKNVHSSMIYANHAKLLPVCVSKMLIHYVTIVRSLEYAIVQKHGFVKPSRDLITVSDEYQEEDSQVSMSREDKIKTLVFTYELGTRNGAQVHKFMEHVSEKFIGHRYTPRYLRQALVFFTRVLLTEKRTNELDMLQHIDALAGHGTATADTQYGVTTTKLHFPSTSKNHIDLHVSRKWHEVLGLMEDDEIKTEPEAIDHRGRLWDIFQRVDFGKVVYDEVGRRLYGNFEFGSVNQLHTVTDALRSTTDLLVVSPTGSGKSNAYKFPVLIEKKFSLPFVTIVISPFISLLEDIKIKIGGIKELVVELFDPEKDNEFYMKCDIIVLQLEKVKEAKSLVSFFESPSVFKYIRRLVVDEAHVLIEQRLFRSQSIFKIGDVFGNGVPKVFLSATFPQTMEETLCNQFSIERSNLWVHREKTIRRNIEHIVVQGEIVASAALRKIYENEIKHQGTRGIVFVYRRDMAEKLGEKLGWLVFHGNLPIEEKMRVYQEFATKEGSMVVATSAFSHGVDVARVGHVITVGGVDNIIDFQQVVGRMWRGEGSKIGRSYVLLDYGFRDSQITPARCVNLVLASGLDGSSDADCEALGCVKCSVCDPQKRVSAGAYVPGIEDREIVRAAEDQESSQEMVPYSMSAELREWMQSHEFNILRMHRLRPSSEFVGKALGCYSDTCFGTLINVGIIEGIEMCNGCFLSQEHAFAFDAEHVCSTSAMQCSLTPLLQGFLVKFLWQAEEPASQLQEVAVTGRISGELRQSYINMVVDAKEGRDREFFHELVKGCWMRGNEVSILSEMVERVNEYIKKPAVSNEQLVYKPTGGSSIMNDLAFRTMVRDSWNRMRIVNEERAFGYCARCWLKGKHQERRECNRDVIVEILVHAYNEKVAMAQYWNQERISPKFGTVCHFVDFMVYREENQEPKFFSFVDFLIRRYEAII